jgi:hypothetical protein
VSDDADAAALLVSRHLKIGWYGLALFLLLGTVLEGFHAFKSPFYLDGGRETTRLLFRLAHAHGTALSIVNIAYALTVRARENTASHFASASLLIALVMLPAGFFLGAITATRGDPGLGIILVPAGAIALFVGVVITARRVSLS